MTPQLRKALLKCCRHGSWRSFHDPLRHRARIRSRIDACTQDGMIAIHRSGRDCDGVHSWSVTHIPAPVSVLAFLKAEDEHNSWLDGPETMSIVTPRDHPEGGETWGGWE
jgi:hypothetical protein